MMWERCASLVQQNGGEVQLGVRVERVRHERGRVVAVEGSGPDGRVEVRADHFVSTMAVRDIVRALDPPPPDDVRRAAERLSYRDYLAVALIVKRAEVFPDNWIYIHSPEVRLGRIQNYKNWSPEMVPDPSRTALGLEYFLWETDPEWTWPEERLIAEGIADCKRIGILTADEVEDGAVVRVPKAYPVYDHGYRDHLALVRRWLEGLGNLQLVGRNGQHRYNNQDHSMLAGVLAARNIAGERHDVWAVNTDDSYHEDGELRKDAGDRLVPARVAAAAQPAVDRLAARVLARLDPVAMGVALGIVGAAGLFAATAALLIKGGPVVGPTLSLLAQYLPGYRVTWSGAVLGAAQALAGGFALGFAGAWLRNRALLSYARTLERRAAAKLRERILDEV
jgi:hypothetical protein